MSLPSDGLSAVRRLVLQRLQSLRRAGVSLLARQSATITDVRSSVAPVAAAAPLTAAPVSPSETSAVALSATPTVAPSERSTVTPTPLELQTPRADQATGRQVDLPSPAPKEVTPPRSPLVASPPAVSPAVPSPAASVVPSGHARVHQLEILRQEVAACERCPQLAQTRKQTVFGTGDPFARLVFIGEAPGADEDRIGEPFVGRAGQLLTDIIEKGMQLKRSDVYILNTLKCRPPENRVPAEDEVSNCRPFFERQLELLQPEFICCLGLVAAQALLRTKKTVGQLRGSWYEYQGSRVLVTYHPSYLLRAPDAKQETWKDIKMLLAAMGLRPPK